jgi:hypothetical protein
VEKLTKKGNSQFTSESTLQVPWQSCSLDKMKEQGNKRLPGILKSQPREENKNGS